MMHPIADATYSEEDRVRRDDLRNHIISFNNSGVDLESSNIFHALPGSKLGSCTDLPTAPKSRSLPKALQPKSPKDEQRSLFFSYRAPMLALPPKSPLTIAPRPVESSELYENQRQSKQRSRMNSFGGFSSQTLSSTPSWKVDSDLVGTSNHTRMSRHEASDRASERRVAPHQVTLQRPNSLREAKAPLPGGAQAHAQMLWIEKARRESEPSWKFTGKEPSWNNKEKQTYRNYQEREQGRNNTEKQPHWNSPETEPRWNDTCKKLDSNHTENELYHTSGLESRLNKLENEPHWNNLEKELHWNNKENEPRFNYTGNETRRNNKEKDPYWNNRQNEPFSSHAEKQPSWNRPEKEPCWNNIEREPHCNNPAKESLWNNTEKKPNLNNREKNSHFSSEPPCNTKEKEPHCNGNEKIERWNNTDKEPYFNTCRDDPHCNNLEKESSRNNTDMEPHWTNSEKNQHLRTSDSAVLPSRYTPASPSVRSYNNQQSFGVEPTALNPQRTLLTQPATSIGGELRHDTSPLYKLSSFRYGSGRELPRRISQNDPARASDLVRGNDLSKATPVGEKTIGSPITGPTFRDRAPSQNALSGLLNKHLSRSAMDLSRGYDHSRGSGERTLPKTSDDHITSGKNQEAIRVPSNTQLGSSRWRALDREERTPNEYIRGRSGQIQPSQTARNRWASLDREAQSPREYINRRTDQISPGNAVQMIKSRRSSFDFRNSAEENTFQKHEDFSRPGSCTPSKQASLADATGRHVGETACSNYRARTRSYGSLSPISTYLYGSEMNLARPGNRQDPGYLAMMSSRNPSARNNDHDRNVTGTERPQGEAARLSLKLNHEQLSGTPDPRCTYAVPLNLAPQKSDFYSTTSRSQSDDVTKNSSVSSFIQMKPPTESYLFQSIAAPDSKSAEFIVHTQGGGSEPSRPLGTAMTVTEYHHSTQMSDGNLTEDSGLGFCPRDESEFNQATWNGEGSIRGAPVESATPSGSARSSCLSPLVGQSRGIVSPRISEKGYVQMLDEKEETTTKEMFTKEDWIRSTKMAGKSPTSVENRGFSVKSRPSDDRRLLVDSTETNTLRSEPPVNWKVPVDSRETSTRGTNRSEPPVNWKVPVDSRETSTRGTDRSEQPVNWKVPVDSGETSTRKDERARSTAAKWKEFLSGSVETDSAGKVQGHQSDEWQREGCMTISENLSQCSEGQGKSVPQWTRKEERYLQSPTAQTETSRTTTSVEESVFDSDEDILERVENRQDAVVASATTLEKVSTSQKPYVPESSSMEHRLRLGDGKISDASQVAERNEGKMENCNGEVSGLREVVIYVHMGALGVGFCIEGGLQSISGDKPITIKRIFTGANGHLRGKLKPGDQILRVNDKDFRQMSHYNAWNFLKTLPEGPAKLLIYAK